MGKQPWLSKTILVGIIVAVAPLIPVVGPMITENIAVQVIGVLMIVLRLITKKPIKLNP